MIIPHQRHKRLQIIFLVLIGLTIPCYGLGYAFVRIDERNRPEESPKPTRTSTHTPEPYFSSTPEKIIPTRFPTFTPTLTPTITPSLTPSPTPTETPSPSWTPEPSPTGTATATQTITPSVTPEPVLPTATSE